jgi:hypothetical protein
MNSGEGASRSGLPEGRGRRTLTFNEPEMIDGAENQAPDDC